MYDHLRQSGFLKLPHKSTLQQYTSFTNIKATFNPDVINRFYADCDVANMKDFERNCSILFDEMKIKSGLVFSKNSGGLIGFTELGDINEEIQQLERQVKERQQGKPLATHVLAIMARGLFKHFNFPLGYFATTTVDSHQLFSIIWEAVTILESIGMNVRAFVCDGASQNRKFFQMHRLTDGANVSPEGVVFWARNRMDPSRKIYFFSDVPHLMKTIRNNLENSGGGRSTRKLMVCF